MSFNAYARRVNNEKEYLVCADSSQIYHSSVRFLNSLGRVLEGGVELYYDIKRPDEVNLVLQLREKLHEKRVPIRDVPPLSEVHKELEAKIDTLRGPLGKLTDILLCEKLKRHNRTHIGEFASAPAGSD